MTKSKILVIGAAGQIGTEITYELSRIHGSENLVATDIKDDAKDVFPNNTYVKLDVMDQNSVNLLFEQFQFDTIYHFAAILSASGEKNPDKTWEINTRGLLNILEAAKEHNVKKIFWPSSIAVFGPNTPKDNTSQSPYMDPATVYGISKLSGELWASYFNDRYNMDIRSIRYPGIISYKTAPGGGTTDYAIDMFFKAINDREYTCFLNKDTFLPMMYMPDAVKATIQLMNAPKEKLSIKTSYNVGSFSISPESLYKSIKQRIPDFNIKYEPDFRDGLAKSWPKSIDDSIAQTDWNWSPEHDLDSMTEHMLDNIKIQLSV